MLLVGSKTTLTRFEDFDFSLSGEQIDRVCSFKHLGVMLNQKWNLKVHISGLLKNRDLTNAKFAIILLYR